MTPTLAASLLQCQTLLIRTVCNNVKKNFRSNLLPHVCWRASQLLSLARLNM